MVSTLARTYRARQQRLRLATINEITNIWRGTYDDRNIRRSFDALTLQAIPLIIDGHLQSTQLGAEYYASMRIANGLNGTFRPVRAGDLSAQRVRKSLEFQAKIGVLKSIKAGNPVETATKAGLVNTIGEATRLAAEGGRETVHLSTQADEQSVGYQRVTGASPCEFCEMLAGRGAVYGKDTGHFEAHRHCDCEAEPVFSVRRRTGTKAGQRHDRQLARQIFRE